MKKGGGGFGFVLAVVVLVIVLLLTARAWKAVMPTAAQALTPAAAGRPGATPQVDDHGQTEAGDAVRSGTLPDLKRMEQSTDQHIRQIQDAAKKQD
jgi:hypothetical protein